MGMSASQARYLSLTARKSDLEFRGQQINQSRLMLSNQSANLYSSMLSMSVPTPPVETDFMKDVYSFSMNGDNTTLSSYKLSMGKDGYGYDILYSKPASTQQLTASTTSEVQKSVTRKASQGNNDISKPVKIKVGYKNADGDETFTSNQSPQKSRLITMNPVTYQANNISFGGEHTNRKLWEQLKKSYNFNYATSSDGTTVDKSKIGTSSNANTFTYDDGEQKLSLHRLTNQKLEDFFGGSASGDTDTGTYNASGGLLEKILGTKDIITNGDFQTSQVYMDQNGDVYVMTSGTNSADTLFGGKGAPYKFADSTTIKKYKLTDILGLTQDTTAKRQGNNVPDNEAVYFSDLYTGTSADQSTDRVYFSGFSFASEKLSFNYSTASQNGLGSITTLNGHQVSKIDQSKLEELGIEEADEKNKTGATNGDNANKSAITYNYYMDEQTGDVWRQQITTSTSGVISESWGLYKAQKQVTVDGNEAQLIDETEWPSGIERSTYSPSEYDCYYVPDETGTGGSYYLVRNDVANGYQLDDVLDNDNTANFTSTRQYNANNTYKIEGMTACVVNEDNVPSTIADAYDLDDYIIYATYDDSDTDFSNPIKYYVFPKDEDDANAVCSYAYEKSYTGKNEILEGRANILVDENGRLSKLNIAGVGTYALEYGQEIDQDAYDEAYKEYEFKLQKYEKEIADIDAKTATIQQQDKKLELQLKSIDTEHSAIQTELEALKKVIDTNIKSSFGTFGG